MCSMISSNLAAMKYVLPVIVLCCTCTNLFAQQKDSLEEVTIVASSRNNTRIENSPQKVEVLGLEEMNEEAGIKPGNIGSILGDVSGVQIQQTSVASGNSNVRIQGLDGKYTQILRDGMPMYDGFAGGLGILTIPPLDLKQIELIKGSASTLYGGGAIGGLVNLISKRPTFKQEADVLINYTSLNEANVNVYTAKRNKHAGYTFFAGYNHQKAMDVNKDGFSDVPDAGSYMVHPKLFFYPTEKTIISAGYNGSFDNRTGGDMIVLNEGAGLIHQYFERNKTQRHTAEYFVEQYMGHNAKLTFKGNASFLDRDISTNTYSVKASQNSFYNELSAYLPFKKSDLAAGINYTGDKFSSQPPTSITSFINNTAGIFAQYSLHLMKEQTIETGLRLDKHNKYGTFLLPRIAIFQRFNEHWAARAGFGMGYKTPNPLAQQTLEYSLLNLPYLTGSLRAELSYGYNAECNYKKEWGGHKSLFINQAFFLTTIVRPVIVTYLLYSGPFLQNASFNTTSKGSDTYVKLQLESWELYLGYTFTLAQNKLKPGNMFIPLTPKDRFALVLVKEIEKQWRFGLEGSYTGRQYRYDLTLTPSYLFIAAMIQRNIGSHVSVVLNCENLLDYRMSRVESLYTGPVSAPSFKPLWAPIDGRIINLSIRWKL